MKLRNLALLSAFCLGAGTLATLAQTSTSPKRSTDDQQSRQSSIGQSSQSSSSLGSSTDRQFNPPGGRPFQGSVNSQGRPFNSGAPGTSTSQSGSSQNSQNSIGASPNSSSLGSPTSSTQPGSSSSSSIGTPGSSSTPGQSSQSSATGNPAGSTSSSAQSSAIGAQGRPGSEQTGANVQVNQQQVTRVQNVLSNIKQGNAGEQKQQLTQTIMSLSPGTKVSHEIVTRFVNDVTTILPRVTLTAPAQQRLATALAYVVTPSVQVTQLEPLLTDVRQVLVQSGLQPIAAQTVACDLHLLAAEAHPELLQMQLTP